MSAASSIHPSPSNHLFGHNDDASDAGLDAPLSTDPATTGAVVWGTTVNVDEEMQTFRSFLQTFTLDPASGPHYLHVLDQIELSESFNINIDASHLYNHSAETRSLYQKLIMYPQELIPIMDLVVHEEFCRDPLRETFLDDRLARIQVRVFNLNQVRRMRELDPEDIDKLVSIRGMVLRVSALIPDMKQAHFKCSVCNSRADVVIDRGHIAEPKKCEACKSKFSFRLVHNRCIFTDRQVVKLQESPDNIPEGETPATVTLLLYDALVDTAKPGDRVLVTGILRAMPVRIDPKKRTIKATYKTHIDVLHIRKTVKGRMASERPHPRRAGGANTEFDRDFNETDEVTAQAEAEARATRFQNMAQSPTLYEDLAQSLAPSIFGHVDVKKGLLLQMLGGTNKDLAARRLHGDNTNDEGAISSLHHTRTRGEINVLLCGDPGTSKSQILSYVHRVAPRGIYTSGKGSSAVGLTAFIVKDPDTRELVLESGALVLSDRGVCCIDEFDKMSDSTRAILHEVMEQQTISLAKAGIICTLNARTSILASANPVGSRYDPKLSMVQNINLPPTLLSRFDLIYLILDKSDPESDKLLARHLVRLYQTKAGDETDVQNQAPYDLATLADYISYCREQCFPRIGTGSASKKLVQSYVQLRQMGSLGGGGRRTVSATPRQLESLIRLAEARAKLRLAEEITPEDVDEAVRLFNVATHRAAMDPKTGTIDMDAITTGVSSVDRLLSEQVASAVRDLCRDSFTSGEWVPMDTLINLLSTTHQLEVPRDALVAVLRDLQSENVVNIGDGRKGGFRVL